MGLGRRRRQWKPKLELGDVCDVRGAVAMCICSGGRRVGRQANARCILDSGWTHPPPRRPGDLGSDTEASAQCSGSLASSPIVSANEPIMPRLEQAQPPACSAPLADRPIQGWAAGSSMRRRKVGKTRAGDGMSEGCSGVAAQRVPSNMGRKGTAKGLRNPGEVHRGEAAGWGKHD